MQTYKGDYPVTILEIEVRRTNGVGGECLYGHRVCNFLRASVKWQGAHAEIESARELVVNHKKLWRHGA